jgi:hypothetical protein
MTGILAATQVSQESQGQVDLLADSLPCQRDQDENRVTVCLVCARTKEASRFG